MSSLVGEGVTGIVFVVHSSPRKALVTPAASCQCESREGGDEEAPLVSDPGEQTVQLHPLLCSSSSSIHPRSIHLLCFSDRYKINKNHMWCTLWCGAATTVWLSWSQLCKPVICVNGLLCICVCVWLKGICLVMRLGRITQTRGSYSLALSTDTVSATRRARCFPAGFVYVCVQVCACMVCAACLSALHGLWLYGKPLSHSYRCVMVLHAILLVGIYL